ncbi:MAG: flagellar hook-basal body complex protein [Alphaproteobacteria bacterium]|nr:flagellar hook-basal body complex protein [Alphaproteobacteria bacterium]
MLSVTMAGLNAAQKSMDVTSNNMSNANTVGFKRSTAVFGDVFSSDPASNPKTAVGSGVMTSSVSRDTTAGAVKTTGRVTDLAIDGRGYFVVQDPAPGAPMTFTRAGNFGLDANGFIVDSSGNQLMGFQAVQSFNSDGSPTLDANGNIVMAPNLNQSRSLKVLPQFAAGSTLPDGSIANQEIQQLSFNGNSTSNSSIIVAGVPIDFGKGDTPEMMAKKVVNALSPAVTNGQLSSVSMTGRPSWPAPMCTKRSATTQDFEPAGAFVDNVPLTKLGLIAGDKYSFAIATSAMSTDTPSTPIALNVSVTVPNDPAGFIAALNSAITEAANTAGVGASDYPTVADGKVTTDNLQSLEFEWPTKTPGAANSSGNTVDVTSDGGNVGGVFGSGSTAAVASTAQPKIQTIDFGSTNATSDMTVSVAGVVFDVHKGDTPASIANRAMTKIAAAFPSPSTVSVDTTNSSKLVISFDPSLKDVKLVRPIYANKKSPAMLSELSKFSTDPVLMQGVSIDPKGQLAATYSNGSTYTMGFLELANFANDAGLKDIGGNRFVQTGTSGQPVITAAGAPKAGNIMSGALEQANVDITSELMDMIRAQQVYNGNARVLQTTVDTVTKITDLR